MREQIAAIQASAPLSVERDCYQTDAIEMYALVRKSSQRLFEALKLAWICADASHSKHSARISVGPEVNDGVQWKIILDYEPAHDRFTQVLVEVLTDRNGY